MQIRLLEIAQQELDEAVTYYNSEQAGLGADFLVEFLNSLERIKAYPQAWKPFTKNTRRSQLRRFPYGIVYQLLENEILIVAISHLHREPGHWQDRLTM
ncbi:MAG: type II toxin-antitoxin system RelE/ParE family toxin [Nitrospirales bacterium]|nr:MAG: type II toxin-antitoxin system RelE/ParE family toxin [Nitrospirales bacterium]